MEDAKPIYRQDDRATRRDLLPRNLGGSVCGSDDQCSHASEVGQIGRLY